MAREWNEMTLTAIRNDVSRPTVHARNLFHTSILMYDAWAIFDEQAETVFLNKTFGGFNCGFNGIAEPVDKTAATEEVMSYAVFRLLKHRFQYSPNASVILGQFQSNFIAMGYDPEFTSIDYSNNSYAALGNYLASEMIAFGLQDGSNEANDYANQYYIPSNPPLILENYYESNPIDPNHWQPLAFDVFIDQGGNEQPMSTPSFVGAEWGQVTPFALEENQLEILNNGFDAYVYNNPGPPPYIQDSDENGIDDPYKWNYMCVASWSRHLDPDNETMIDISPASHGNVDIANFPQTFDEYKSFYNYDNGGDMSTGYTLNPKTGVAYEPQMVKRGDYGRVLAEFWADGPNSETPPGHWYTILNHVSDDPLLEKRIAGEGDIVSDLEWDVKSYLALGGAMHDVAVNIWGIKGYYDSTRPISAIRYMAGKGQSSNASLPSYDPQGIPLVPGFVELIASGDPLSGDNNENVNKIKIMAWMGPDFVEDPTIDHAGVNWIMGTHWWPYQRATFVSPPFAGYLSGHSSFSRAGAEILTRLTGDPFFPGGMGVFDMEANNFLVFEVGPTQNMELQWATYRDASDQASLSRIYGGIHPPIDDIRGRIIGSNIGNSAFDKALTYYQGSLHTITADLALEVSLFPVPFKDQVHIKNVSVTNFDIQITGMDGKVVMKSKTSSSQTLLNLETLTSGVYFMQFTAVNGQDQFVKKVVKY